MGTLLGRPPGSAGSGKAAEMPVLGLQLAPRGQRRLSWPLPRVTRGDAVTAEPGSGCSCCPLGNEARGRTADLWGWPRGPGRQRPRAWPGGGRSGQRLHPETHLQLLATWWGAGRTSRRGDRGPAATASDAAGPRGDRPSWGQGLRLLLRRGTLGVRTERGLGKPGWLVAPPRPRAAGCYAPLLERPPGSELRGDQAAEVGGPGKPRREEGPHAPGWSLCGRLSRAAAPAENVARRKWERG